MNFLKLMDPYRPRNIVNGLDDHCMRAQKLFPDEVAKSRLTYWREGDLIPQKGVRFLVGAATYSLPDLRFLDVINQIIRDTSPDVLIEVIDIFDAEKPGKWETFFPGAPRFVAVPVIGKWVNGKPVRTLAGAAAMDEVLAELRAGVKASEITCNLRPTAEHLMADYDV